VRQHSTLLRRKPPLIREREREREREGEIVDLRQRRSISSRIGTLFALRPRCVARSRAGTRRESKATKERRLPEDAHGDGSLAQRSFLVHLDERFRSDGGSVSRLTFVLDSCNIYERIENIDVELNYSALRGRS